jgi:hypothetical protein
MIASFAFLLRTASQMPMVFPAAIGFYCVGVSHAKHGVWKFRHSTDVRAFV